MLGGKWVVHQCMLCGEPISSLQYYNCIHALRKIGRGRVNHSDNREDVPVTYRAIEGCEGCLEQLAGRVYQNPHSQQRHTVDVAGINARSGVEFWTIPITTTRIRSKGNLPNLVFDELGDIPPELTRHGCYSDGEPDTQVLGNSDSTIED